MCVRIRNKFSRKNLKKGGFMRKTVIFGLIFIISSSFLIPATVMQKLFIIKKVFPDAKNIVIFFNKKLVSTDLVREASIAKTAMKYNIVLVNVEKKSALGSAASKYLKNDYDYVMIYTDSMIFNSAGKKLFCQKAIKKKVPVISDTKDDLKYGAFGSVESDGGKLVMFVNKKASQILGISLPEDPKVIVE